MLSYYTANKILNAFVLKVEDFKIDKCYVALSQTEPNRDGTNVTEPKKQFTDVIEGEVVRTASTGYDRVWLCKVDQPSGYSSQFISTTKMSEADAGQSKNIEIIYFPEVLSINDIQSATEEEKLHPWGTCKYLCLYDAATGGNLMAYSQLVDDAGQPTQIQPTVLQLPIVRKNQFVIDLK